MITNPQSLDEIIQLRLQLTQNERLAIKEALEQADARVQHLMKLGSSIGPRDSEYDKLQLALDGEKASRTSLSNALQDKDRQLEYLYINCQKLKIASSNVTEDYSPTDSTLVSLMVDNATLAREIETRCNVRIDLSRTNKLCKISGQQESVRAAIVEVQKIDSARIQIPVDTVIEEAILADEHTMSGCILGDGGQQIRNLQKDFNVEVHTDRGTNNDEPEKLVIRGPASCVSKAVAKINEILTTYRASLDVIEMPDEIISLIVGKKGSRIAALREKFPDATIDIEPGGSIRVHSINPATRQAIREALDTLISSNYVYTLPIVFDMGVLMKGPRGTETRSLLTTDLGMTFDILPEDGCIKLRGNKRHVEMGIEIIESFVNNNYFVDIPCSEDDFSTVFVQATESPLKGMETQYNVELRTSRKEGTVRIRGSQVSVTAARTALEGLLNGDLKQSSQIFSVHPQIFQYIIGKSGGTLKRLEKDASAKIDILKVRNLIRVRATTPSGALSARGVLLSFIDDIKTSTTIDLTPFVVRSTTTAASQTPNETSELRIDRLLESTSFLYGVELARDNGSKNMQVNAKGLLRFIECAKQHLMENLSETVQLMITLPNELAAMVWQNGGKLVQSIRETHKVTIDCIPSPLANTSTTSSATTKKDTLSTSLIPSDSSSALLKISTLTIHGVASAAVAARGDLWRVLEVT